MNGTADDQYLEWLYSQIAPVTIKNPRHSYWKLARQLYSKPFYWFVHNDDNRAMDGRLLREEFAAVHGYSGVDQNWMDLDCSFLELLIALSRRLEFQSTTGTAEAWFWKLMENVGFAKYSDNNFNRSIQEEVDEAMERIMRRTYARDGTGGLFPLREPHTDMRNAEIWYQMHAYLLEGDRVDNGPRG